MNCIKSLCKVFNNVVVHQKYFSVVGPVLASSRKYGQPTEWTHSHIIGKNEVNKGISKSEFQHRRQRLMENLQKMKSTGTHILIIPASKRQYMIEKIPYFYRQDTDFRYLTGCLQPDNVLVMEFNKDGGKCVLFCQEHSAYDEKWEGPRLGYSEAEAFLGVDEAVPLKSLEEYLNSYAKHVDLNLWYDYMEPRHADIHKIVLNFLQEMKNINFIESPRSTLHDMRVIKSSSEIQLMRETCRIGAEAIKSAISQSRNLKTEGQILATIEYDCRMSGACHLAYPPVIAAGSNSTVIHYINATGKVCDDDLVLVDAGCEYHGYTSDITRTWPARGWWSEKQLKLYQVVLETQLSLISSIVPGVTTVDILYRDMQSLLAKHLQAVGLIDKEAQYLSARVHEFCPHHVSHYLGMDVHDCSRSNKKRPLESGMVITVEPGVYIPNHKSNVDSSWWGLGCRIEDDILITESGVEILSSGCPKHVDDINNLIQQS